MKGFGVNGTVVLTIASFIGKMFGAIYRIPLSNMVGAQGIGLYQMAFPIYSFFLTFITGGVGVILSKDIAQKRAMGDEHGVYKIFKLGINTCLFFGLFITALLLLFAKPFSVLQGNSSASLGYMAISVGFVFASIIGAYRGYYQGYGNMYPTAISQIIEQVSKLIFGLTLTFFLSKKSIILGVCGGLLGVSISEVFAFLYFAIKNKKIKRYPIKLTGSDYFKFAKELSPISMSYGILPLSSLIDSFLIINLLTSGGILVADATSIYGIQTGMILPLINIPNVLISALAITTIPKLSYKMAKKESIILELKRIFKIVIIFLIPCTVGMFFISDKIVQIIYPTLNILYKNLAINLLKISVFEMFFLCFVGISNSILQAMGKIKKPLKSMAIGVFVKIILEIILVQIPQINIFGLVISNFFCYFVIGTLNIIEIKKNTNFFMNFKSIIYPIISSIIMGAFIAIMNSLIFKQASIYVLLFIVIISVLLYFSFLILMGELTPSFFKNMLQKEDT